MDGKERDGYGVPVAVGILLWTHTGNRVMENAYCDVFVSVVDFGGLALPGADAVAEL